MVIIYCMVIPVSYPQILAGPNFHDNCEQDGELLKKILEEKSEICIVVDVNTFGGPIPPAAPCRLVASRFV